MSSNDLLAIVQSGASKKITYTDFLAALTADIPSASTSAEGLIEIATNAETATGTDTARAVTPDDMRYGGANGTFQKIVLNGATGSASNGDMNISGSYLVNGVALSTISTNTPVAYSAVTSVTITVDFTTYTHYELDIYNNDADRIEIVEGSSNAGSSYATTTFRSIAQSGASTVTGANNDYGNDTAVGQFFMELKQVLTTAAVGFKGGSTGANRASFFAGSFGLTAACNRIRFSFASGNAASGSYVIRATNKR